MSFLIIGDSLSRYYYKYLGIGRWTKFICLRNTVGDVLTRAARSQTNVEMLNLEKIVV